MHVNVSHVKSDNHAIETEYLLFKTKFLQGLHHQLTVGITYASGHTISAGNCYLLQVKALFPFRRWYPLFYSTGKGQRKPELQAFTRS